MFFCVQGRVAGAERGVEEARAEMRAFADGELAAASGMLERFQEELGRKVVEHEESLAREAETVTEMQVWCA